MMLDGPDRMDGIHRGPGEFELDLPRGGSWKIGPRPALMGILNCTPDSFSDGGQYADAQAAVDGACGMVEDGADIIDIGAESTRPGSVSISSEEEIERLSPVLSSFRSYFAIP